MRVAQRALFEAGAPTGAALADNRRTGPLADAFGTVPDAWRATTDPFFASPAGRSLAGFVDARIQEGAAVYPGRVFRALDFAPPAGVRLVIVGQDPYHGAGQAQGLAFSVPAGVKVPPSLRNILSEIAADTGAPSACRDDLTPWAEQGVLLLNSVLTVEHALPQSHAGRGWEALTDALIAHVAECAPAAVFMLWGAAAQRKRGLIDGAAASRHLVLAANHPSPLSARRGPVPFVGCRHFSRANAFLAGAAPHGPAIDW